MSDGARSGELAAREPGRDTRAAELDALAEAQAGVEHALLLGLARAEASALLHRAAGLQPALTELVWDKLEAQNEAFFAAHAHTLVHRASFDAARGDAYCALLAAAMSKSDAHIACDEDDSADSEVCAAQRPQHRRSLSSSSSPAPHCNPHTAHHH